MATSFFGSATNNGESISTAFSGNFASFFDLKSLLESANLNSTLTGVILYAVENTYSVVNSSGVQILIFLSALQTIPSSLFEASKVEGATKWEEFWKITFPMLTPMILVNIVYTIIDSFTNPKYEVLQYILDNSFTNSPGDWIFLRYVLDVLPYYCDLSGNYLRPLVQAHTVFGLGGNYEFFIIVCTRGGHGVRTQEMEPVESAASDAASGYFSALEVGAGGHPAGAVLYHPVPVFY